ncbi:MoxR family ATPase [Thermodesulfobacterium sp.]|jgi:midasin (ATPase involved in ribosome maturation)|uniref:MoxR family ATPase n=1 Tax=Thermodesulfobacterium sp. TaxID=1965289 RepID=UPI00257A8C78|nr:MoxR family ATPase [Thermodesulfobacterium sp.]MBZ4681109.1 ATPase [Thermodesulfobacterium sp.]MDN5379105.1 MoxR-like ATPase [Thermodesulfobacterium sp.]
METAVIDGVTLYLSHPDELDIPVYERKGILDQILACWLTVDEKDLPLTPRLVGKPGVGKTTLAYLAAKKLNKPVYIFQATVDTRPEDLIVTPVISEDKKIRYMASPIVSAMIKGGVAIIDEANRMSEKSWASLAPLLDSRRYVESVVAGIKIKAHKEFRLCVTMNEDASTFELPEYIQSRLQPQIFIDFPEAEEERYILKTNLPWLDETTVNYIVDFLQITHQYGEPYSVRDGVNIGRYVAKKLIFLNQTSPATQIAVLEVLKEAISLILGPQALVFFKEFIEKGRKFKKPTLFPLD